MSEKFSATLRIGDLNDFIAPSQGCVVSMKSGSSRLVDKPKKPMKAAPATETLQTDPVKISLKDCLACSGCITSAETVMLEKQSLDEFLSNINNGKTVIVSLSPQSRASIAVHYGLSPVQVFRKLITLFKSLGVKAVFDTSCSRDLTLIESCNEFISRYKQNHSDEKEESRSFLPMISSACPGWICYAEKTLGSYVLPYISSVKSPQQSIGAIIKHHLCQKLGLRPAEIYHVTVMPCYDKKLEASRDDFVFRDQSDEGSGSDQMTTEVDSVLTTGEVLDLIQSKAVDFSNLEESPLDKLLSNVSEEGHLFGVRGSSGGYADTIFRYAAKTLFGQDIKGPLDFKTIRNSDFQEVTLEVEGKTVLKFALCYGFRNLQNVVRKLKIGKCDYHYLEIMACPSGCLNGGGQLKPKPGQSGKDLIQALEITYMEKVLAADPFENLVVKSLYDGWLEYPGSEKAKQHIHTEYHPIVKSITSQLHNW
ncbi:protein NAR1 isoform X1 [Cynara cardunculus var. scolymus]|uniref:protein NAR1 isoform X1 n=2 Tax=Cynara cardunculus var. scolymus TaxID=59895 RepID=UPI000D62E73F|nr:protein NAR1 isoform X1 [Cynara cardunculus var. scolymus]